MAMEVVSEVINVLLITIVIICGGFGMFLYKHSKEYNKIQKR